MNIGKLLKAIVLGGVVPMKQTLESISTMFGNNDKINDKLFYLPIGQNMTVQ